MKIKLLFFFSLCNLIFMQDVSDSTKINYADSKAPLIIGTLPFINEDPTTVAMVATLLISASKSDSLSIDMNNPNMAMFLGSFPLLAGVLSSNEILLIPSIGQIYNKKVFKSFIMSCMKTFWLTEYKRTKDINIKDRNRSLWWLLILMLYGMADAYVDAQLNQNIKNGDGI
tara:strand:- start:391 stop:903 length:513 start_codon:yes stop_codon:yes gene_type:complete